MQAKIDDIVKMPSEHRQYFEYIGLDTVNIEEDGSFSLCGEVEEHMLNPNGIMHAGVMFTLCDNAAAIYLGLRKWLSVTVCSNMSFLIPARKGDYLTARVLEQKMGKRLAVLRIEILNQDNQLVAEGIFHMHRVLPESHKPAETK